MNRKTILIPLAVAAMCLPVAALPPAQADPGCITPTEWDLVKPWEHRTQAYVENQIFDGFNGVGHGVYAVSAQYERKNKDYIFCTSPTPTGVVTYERHVNSPNDPWLVVDKLRLPGSGG